MEIIPVVAACIVAPYTSFILLHKKDEAEDEQGIPRNPELLGRWEFVGGMMEYGETPEQALRRECQEEIGQPVNVGKLIHAQTNIYADGKHYLVLFYKCTLTDWREIIKGCQWFKRQEVEALNALPGTLEVIGKLAN